MVDGEVGGDGRAEGERDQERLFQPEMIDQAEQIDGLVLDREAVVRHAGAGMAAPVVGQAGVTVGEGLDLRRPVVEAVDFAVDEHDAGAVALDPAIEIAAVDADFYCLKLYKYLIAANNAPASARP